MKALPTGARLRTPYGFGVIPDYSPPVKERSPHMTVSTGRPRGRPRTTPLAPCAICKDPGGRLDATHRTPPRMSLTRFGLDGFGCTRCFERLKWRAGHNLPLAPERFNLRDPKEGADVA